MDPAQELEAKMFLKQTSMNETMKRGDSEIQQFYNNAVVFVTGGSGFLGKLLVEKLFRSCNIKRLYLLARPKKNKSSQQRVADTLEDSVFDAVRKKQPNFAEKIMVVEGDVAELKLGLNHDDWKTLSDEITVIFHLAATTRFDEKMKLAALINVRGTREVITLAKECQNLKSFIHVSTAFTHATECRVNTEIVEEFYHSPIPPETMIKMAEEMDSGRLEGITPELKRGWPNTYTFTKAIAEEAIKVLAKDLPVCIVRPPVVACTYYEPAPGWIDMSCVFGISGILLGVGLGAMHVLMDRNPLVTFAPADYVNNATIAAGWDSVMRRHDDQKEIMIYNISNLKSNLRWRQLTHFLRYGNCRDYATPKAVWYCYCVQTQSHCIYWLLTWLLHYIPAYIVDGVCSVLGIKLKEFPSLIKLYTKIYESTPKFYYFLSKEWYFKDDNIQEMMQRMSPDDRVIYNFNLSDVDWNQLILIWCVGLRRYIVKDGLVGSEYGRRKQFWFRLGHYAFMAMYFYAFWMIFSLIYKCVCLIF